VRPSPRTRNVIRSYVYAARASNTDETDGGGSEVFGPIPRAEGR